MGVRSLHAVYRRARFDCQHSAFCLTMLDLQVTASILRRRADNMVNVDASEFEDFVKTFCSEHADNAASQVSTDCIWHCCCCAFSTTGRSTCWSHSHEHN